MIINFLSLRYFIEVSNQLSFSKASKTLHISQPGLSQQISSLEKQLGFKLLNRTTRKISLTEEGEYLYKKLSPSFYTIEKTLSKLVESKGIPKPNVQVAAVPSAASTYIPHLLKRIISKYPEVEFHLHETTSSSAISLVNQQKCHLGFIRTPINKDILTNEGLSMLEFQHSPLQLVVSTVHPFAQKKSIDLSEAKDELFIHYDGGQAHSLQFLLEKACTSSGFVPKELCKGSELLTIAHLIANNLGVALMPKDMADLLEKGQIKALPIEHLQLTSSISVVWNNENIPSFPTDFIIQALKDHVSFSS